MRKRQNCLLCRSIIGGFRSGKGAMNTRDCCGRGLGGSYFVNLDKGVIVHSIPAEEKSKLNPYLWSERRNNADEVIGFYNRETHELLMLNEGEEV